MRFETLAALTLGASSMAACAHAPPRPSRPVPSETVRVEPVRPSLEVPSMTVERRDRGGEPADGILDSPWTLHPEFAAEVRRWVDRWRGPGREWFAVYLQRMTAYRDVVDEELARRELPRSLRYLPLIESGYATGAVSSASAVGLWQLMAPTAREGGMRVGALVDERRDPVRATAVALGYLEELHGRYGSWFLALAAYNAGPGRVDRVLERHAPGAVRSDGLYWLVRPHLPRETRDFVPRFVAAGLLASDPGGYGLDPVPAAPGLSWDEVQVPDATTLDVVARAAGVSEAEIELLNPHILRRITPRGVTTGLRVPSGTGELFREAYALIPPAERVTVREHRVESGDTLWGIARRYGVALQAVREANPSVKPERIRPGDRLLVPLAPPAQGGR